MDIPASSRPRVFMDIGDNDPELTMAKLVEAQFNEHGLSHEWHLYSGAHTEEYWGAHVEEYIQWYAEGWNNTTSKSSENHSVIPNNDTFIVLHIQEVP
jgi:hypothetical protein